MIVVDSTKKNCNEKRLWQLNKFTPCRMSQIIRQ